MTGITAAVLLVVDDERLQRSLRDVLDGAGLTVEPYSTPADLVASYDPSQPACLVLAARFREGTALQLVEALRERGGFHPFIIVSQQADDDVRDAVESMRAGAVDYLREPCNGDILVSRVREAIQSDLAARREHNERREHQRRLDTLTPREREILELVVQGLLTKQIARELGISPKTVEVHRSNITKKMGVESTTQLVALLIRRSPSCLHLPAQRGCSPVLRTSDDDLPDDRTQSRPDGSRE